MKEYKLNEKTVVEVKDVQNIIESVIRIYTKMVDDQKIDTAIRINYLLKQAEEKDWDLNYVNALKDVKKNLKITNTIYDLYV